MKNKLSRGLIGIFLLIVGFFVGTAWTNKDEDKSTSDKTEESTALQANDEMEPGAAIESEMESNMAKLLPSELETINLFEKASESVTFITTSNLRRNYYRRNITEVPRGTGSGFIWDKEGHVITNYHVVKGADKAQVTLSNGESYPAKLIGYAAEKDLAVLKIEVDNYRMLKPLPVGSSDFLRVGQSVYAIGNPFGLDQTLTTGIISALGREIASVSGVPIKDVIQTDAAINPGNSGGPLLNSSGDLIGVNTAIYSPSGAYAGIGFSIPVDVVKWVVPDLIQYGKINRPTLGVEFATTSVTQQLGLKGALIIFVIENSEAAKAGLLPTMQDRYGRILLGDIIIGIDNYPIKSANDLTLALENYKAGDTVQVKYVRDKKEEIVEIVLKNPN